MIACPKPERPVLDRFCVMAAWAIRNALRARVLLVQDIFDLMREGDMPEIDLLLIPDFVAKKAEVHPRERSWMTSLLHARHAAGQQTVIYVQSELVKASATIEAAYGVLVAQHIHDHFDKGIE